MPAHALTSAGQSHYVSFRCLDFPDIVPQAWTVEFTAPAPGARPPKALTQRLAAAQQVTILPPNSPHPHSSHLFTQKVSHKIDDARKMASSSSSSSKPSSLAPLRPDSARARTSSSPSRPAVVHTGDTPKRFRPQNCRGIFTQSHDKRRFRELGSSQPIGRYQQPASGLRLVPQGLRTGLNQQGNRLVQSAALLRLQHATPRHIQFGLPTTTGWGLLQAFLRPPVVVWLQLERLLALPIVWPNSEANTAARLRVTTTLSRMHYRKSAAFPTRRSFDASPGPLLLGGPTLLLAQQGTPLLCAASNSSSRICVLKRVEELHSGSVYCIGMELQRQRRCHGQQR